LLQCCMPSLSGRFYRLLYNISWLSFYLPLSVWIPGGSVWGDRDGRPPMDGTFPAAPCVWGLWSCSHSGPQTNEGELERGGLPYQR
jgi:hypothetical protein